VSSIALFALETQFIARRQLLLGSHDPFVFEQVLAVGDHPGYTIEEAEGSLFLIFGGHYAFTPSRSIGLHYTSESWTDRRAIEELGGPRGIRHCRINPGNLPSLLEQFWPAARKAREEGDYSFYLACLLYCPVYGFDYVVTAHMGRRGYALKPYPLGETGDFDGNAEVAVPL
jgi:hypothetical protein